MAKTPKTTVSEYHPEKHGKRQILGIADFKEEDIEAIEHTLPLPEAAKFDHEISYVGLDIPDARTNALDLSRTI